jgi:hypothetical protein
MEIEKAPQGAEPFWSCPENKKGRLLVGLFYYGNRKFQLVSALDLFPK